jgi:hypothetical protein
VKKRKKRPLSKAQIMKTNNKKLAAQKTKSTAIDSEPTEVDSSGMVSPEFEIWLEEYKLIQDQILKRQEADEKSYESLMITVSAVVAASSLVINYKAYFLLLLLSLPFHILLLKQARRSIVGASLWRYMTRVVAPKLNSLAQEHRRSSEIQKFVGWEQNAANDKQLIWFVRVLPKSARSALQFGASIVLVVLYFTFRNDPQYEATPVDLLLLIINLLAAIASLIAVSARMFRIWRRKT